MDAERRYKVGNEFPYDDGREASDWAHKAARGILSDLLDRRGIKWEFQAVDDNETRCNIVDSMAAIIRHAATHLPPQPQPPGEHEHPSGETIAPISPKGE